MCEEGISLEQDIKTALYFYKLAGSQGDERAIAKIEELEKLDN